MLVTTLAPCFMSSFVPTENVLVIFPGTASTFFPCSKAKSAVIIAPLSCLASTTTTSSENPAIILFLSGNVYLLLLVPATYSLKSNPLFAITLFSNSVFSGGYTYSRLLPFTTIVPLSCL